MKRILFFFFFILSVYTVKAQSPRLFAGADAGLNLSRFNTNLFDTKFRPGINFGTNFQATLKSGLGLRTEMRYSQLGSIRYTDIYSRKYYRTSYLSFLPLLSYDFMRWKVDSRLYAVVGPEVQAYISHHQDVPENAYTKRYRKAVISATGGVTYMHQVAYPLWMTFSVRYTHGISNVVKFEEVPETENVDASSLNMTHQGLSLLVGFAMPIK